MPKISELPTDTAPLGSDLSPFVDVSAGRTEVATYDNIAASVPFSERYLALAASAYNVMESGNSLRDAIGDGTVHPLSERFGSLADAQAVFPRAMALTEQIDRHAIQYAFDTRDDIYIPASSGDYICDVRSVEIASVSITSNVLTVTTASAHGYTSTDVTHGHTVRIGGFTTATDATDLTFLNTEPGIAIVSVPSPTTMTFAFTASDLASKSVAVASHPAVRLASALFTRSADAGDVYASAYSSANGVGSQRITMAEGAVLRLAPSALNYFGVSGYVLSTGNAREITTWNLPLSTTSRCDNLRLDIEVDGNRANNASTWSNSTGVRLFACSNLVVTRAHVYNAYGDGLIHTGLASGAYTTSQTFEYLHVHDNGLNGFSNSLRTRRVHYGYIHAHDNGQFGGGVPGILMGALIDQSECTVGAIYAHDNAGHGVMFNNVYAHNDQSITARGNGACGIYVLGMVASQGGQWLAVDNSRGSSGTYDDVFFDNDDSKSYGVTKATTVASIVAGYDNQTADYASNTARYNVYVEDDIGSLQLPQVRYLTAGLTGTYRAPATTTASFDGQSFGAMVTTVATGQLAILGREIGDTGLRNVSSSGLTFDAAWTTVTEATLRRTGNVVSVQFVLTASSIGAAQAITTLPAGFRPDGQIRFAKVADTVGGSQDIYVGTNGEFRFNGTGSLTPRIRFTFTTRDAWPASLPGSAA